MFDEWELYEQTEKIYGTASQKGDIVLVMYHQKEWNTWLVYNPIRDVRFIIGSLSFKRLTKIEGVIE